MQMYIHSNFTIIYDCIWKAQTATCTSDVHKRCKVTTFISVCIERDIVMSAHASVSRTEIKKVHQFGIWLSIIDSPFGI